MCPFTIYTNTSCKMVNTRYSTNVEKANEETVIATDDHSADPEVNRLLGTLSEESRSLVQVLTKIISMQFGENLATLREALTEKDKQIKQLTCEVNGLKEKVNELEINIDSVDQYERRDTVIFSGPTLPPETNSESTDNIVLQAIKDNLHMNISISHRLGPHNQQRNRPIIVKLSNRTLKQDLVGACVRLKPQLYIKESLTPRRRVLFSTILQIRRSHKQKFQQCYTKDGRIIIKLRNSTVKHTVIDEKSLMSFLEKYPEMLDTFRNMTY